MAKITSKEFPTGTQLHKTDDSGKTVIRLKLKKPDQKYTQERIQDAKGTKKIRLKLSSSPAPAPAPAPEAPAPAPEAPAPGL